MKQFIAILLVLQTSLLFAQKEKKYIHQGNKLYQEQKYTEAEKSYRQSLEKKNQTLEGNFNLGDALYKQKKFAEAGEQFSKITASPSGDKKVIAKAYHNLGNSLLEGKKLEESIAAYKKALINSPKDDETRYNLAYAQQLLKKQQEQKNKDKKDKNKDKKDQDKDKKDQDKKDQNKDPDKKNQDQKDQPQPNKLSKEDAERMLEALNNQEQNTQEKLKNKKLKGAKVNITKDW